MTVRFPILGPCGALVVLMVAGMALQLSGQVSGSRRVSGTVVGTHGGAVGNALVTLSGPFASPNPGREVLVTPNNRMLANQEGVFVFEGVREGFYLLRAAKDGFLQGSYGSLAAGEDGQALRVSTQARTGIRIVLWPQPTLSGTVTDGSGSSLANVTVRAFRRLHEGVIEEAGSAVTGARGSFNILNLTPGEYCVAVLVQGRSSPDARVDRRVDSPAHQHRLLSGTQLGIPVPSESGEGLRVPRTTFFPSASSPDAATFLSLDAGTVTDGLHIVMQSVPAIRRVHGTLAAEDRRRPGVRIAFYLADGDSGGGLPPAWEALTDPTGAFELVDVAPGRYLARATIPPAEPGSGDYFLREVVTVDAAGSSLNLVMRRGYSVRGAIAGNLTLAERQGLRGHEVVLEALDANSAQTTARARFTSAGEFSFPSVAPGSYTIRLDRPNLTVPTYLSWNGAVWRGHDVAHSPLVVGSDVAGIEILVHRGKSGITGTVSAPAGGPDARARVVFIPTSPELRARPDSLVARAKVVRVADDGVFEALGLPAGEYAVGTVVGSKGSRTPAEFLADSLRWPKVLLAPGQLLFVPLTSPPDKLSK